MRSKLRQLITAMLCLTGCMQAQKPTNDEVQRWAAYYNSAMPEDRFEGYDLLVLDRRYHPNFADISGNPIILAYVSAGEVHDGVPEKETLAHANMLLAQQPKWKSHIVDITSPLWRGMVERQVDDAIARGFDGVMLDTIDSPLDWAATNNRAHLNATSEAAIMMIEAIRTRHPYITIMLNRGFAILPVVIPHLDFVLYESLLTNPNETTGQFTFQSPTNYEQAAKKLQQMITLAPHIRILTLDYWKLEDVSGLGRIYATQRGAGFIPYVSTPDLRQLAVEPSISEFRL